MDLDTLPSQLRAVLNALTGAMRAREPAIIETVSRLRAQNPGFSPDELAQLLIRRSRRRIAATGAVSGAAAIAPGLGTLVAIGTATGQSMYALEQQTELVMGIAHVYGHQLSGSDERMLEALVVVGLAGGAVQLRENVLVAGGQRMAVAAMRKAPEMLLTHAGGRIVARVLARVVGTRGVAAVARLAPMAVGMAIGAGFDWLSVTAMGRAAVRYYGPGGPASRFPASPAVEDRPEIETRS